MSMSDTIDVHSGDVPPDAIELTEAEIQVLVSLKKAEIGATPTDRASLEEGGARYSNFLEDWSDAYAALIAKGLIDGDDTGYRLTDTGRPLGQAYHRQRPDKYWYYYQRFYPAAHASVAHSRFCERVYGKDMCQEGMVDMATLDDLLARLDLKPGDHLLDLGCGAGGIAEYISDQTGARVTGLDYSAPAITVANERTQGKRARLTFIEGDMNDLDLPAQSFDAAISLDTLYWVADLPDTLSQVVRAIKPGGQIGIQMLQSRPDGASPDILEADKTRPAQALAKLNLTYDAHDHTSQNAAFWRQYRDVVAALRDDFEAEGNGFIVAEFDETVNQFLPAFEAGTLTRYFYHVRL